MFGVRLKITMPAWVGGRSCQFCQFQRSGVLHVARGGAHPVAGRGACQNKLMYLSQFSRRFRALRPFAFRVPSESVRPTLHPPRNKNLASRQVRNLGLLTNGSMPHRLAGMSPPPLLCLRRALVPFIQRLGQTTKRRRLLSSGSLLFIATLWVYIWRLDVSHEPTALDAPVPFGVWWRNAQNLTIWTVWIGSSIDNMPQSILAATESCRKVHENEPSLQYRIVTDVDLSDPRKHLGFELHPSFHLLDSIEQSDYLRGELLHHHGGFYLDADMLCLQSLKSVLEQSAFDVAGAQDYTQYHPWPAFSQNALGPVRPNTNITRYWHEELHRTMNKLTPKLQNCLEKHATSTIPYPKPRYHGVSICGVKWGELIEFMKPLWSSLATSQKLGNALIMCDTNSRHLGYDRKNALCTISHLGTAGPFFKKAQMTRQQMCQQLKVLKGHPLCE